MPWALQRFQQAHCLHFITCSCYHRAPLLATPNARRTFERTLEQTHQWYGFYITGYVVMPEHFHLLLSEPVRGNLAVALQMLKQNTSRQLREFSREGHFWQERYYDFNVWSEAKRLEKLHYLHRNPVARGLVERPEDWEWSSFQHYISGTEGVVEIESPWTARKRELQGWTPQCTHRDENPRPVAQNATRTGHPIKLKKSTHLRLPSFTTQTLRKQNEWSGCPVLVAFPSDRAGNSNPNPRKLTSSQTGQSPSHLGLLSNTGTIVKFQTDENHQRAHWSKKECAVPPSSSATGI